jgi:hypothetical protein
MQDGHQDSLDFYISYDKADRLWAEWIAWQLNDSKYSIVIEVWDFLPGSNIVLKKQQALQADRVIAVLSPDYLNSSSTQPDWAVAFLQDPSGQKGTLLPVYVRKCEPKGQLASIIPIDLVDLDEPSARKELLEGVDRERKKPTASPLFPGRDQGSPQQTRSPHFPGYLPPIWNVPRYNPFFTNREDILKRLYEALRVGTAGLVHIQAIGGLGGIGKTQTAIAYAYQHRHIYQSVLWVNAEKPETFEADLMSIANLLDMPKKDEQDLHQTVTYVKQWLEIHTDQQWLLILDNIEDAQAAMNFIPSVGNGHILLTTRAQAMGTIAQSKSIELDKIETEHGALFLLRRAKIIESDATLDDVSANDRAIALEISRAMGSLPLALDQAGAYIEESSCSLEEYLSRYQKQRARLLKRRGGIASDQPFDHPEPVATTWSLSFEKVQQANPLAFEVLQLCAFLYPDMIPEEIIAEGLPKVADELDDIIIELRKFSLLHRNSTTKTLTIHRLVQVVLRDEMDEKTLRQLAELTVQAVHRAFPSAEPVIWQDCQRYFPHVQTCAVLIEQWNLVFPEAAQLLHRMGCRLHEHKHHALNEPLFIQALSIWQKAMESDQLDLARVLENYATLLRKMQYETEAVELEKHAQAITNWSSSG